MTEAPKRIWAWPDKGNPESVTGRWSCNTYSSDLTQPYILAAEHERLMAERDAEIGTWRMVAETNEDTVRIRLEQVAGRDAEIARLREALEEIAHQKLIPEMGEDDRRSADYVTGYEMCVERARAALGDDNG